MIKIKTAELPGQVLRVKYWIENLAHLQSIEKRCKKQQTLSVRDLNIRVMAALRSTIKIRKKTEAMLRTLSPVQ